MPLEEHEGLKRAPIAFGRSSRSKAVEIEMDGDIVSID